MPTAKKAQIRNRQLNLKAALSSDKSIYSRDKHPVFEDSMLIPAISMLLERVTGVIKTLDRVQPVIYTLI